jgi:hypothetical protein
MYYNKNIFKYNENVHFWLPARLLSTRVCRAVNFTAVQRTKSLLD